MIHLISIFFKLKKLKTIKDEMQGLSHYVPCLVENNKKLVRDKQMKKSKNCGTS
jgi:hypothetical protein